MQHKAVYPILYSYKSVINKTVCLDLYTLYNKMQPRKLRHRFSRSETKLGTVCATVMMYI